MNLEENHYIWILHIVKAVCTTPVLGLRERCLHPSNLFFFWIYSDAARFIGIYLEVIYFSGSILQIAKDNLFSGLVDSPAW